MTAQEWAEELAEELVSAANIVTIGGCYEVDIDRVSLELSRRCVPIEEYQRVVGELRKISYALDQAAWADRAGEKVKRISFAASAIDRIQAALKETGNAD